jgi:hypothetical protein
MKINVILERDKLSDLSGYWYNVIFRDEIIGSVSPEMVDDGITAYVIWDASPYVHCLEDAQHLVDRSKKFRSKQKAIDYVVNDLKKNPKIAEMQKSINCFTAKFL